ncbi:MAG: hypothetical protein HA489_05410 [Archaeoglobales archaeon]|jgi:hypothetical protein|nr:hypothetical protein [Archaeoglobales archaeon]TDA27993.1 MAG: hypothetical protein DSO00_06160 [Archaeoglobi archaeon]
MPPKFYIMEKEGKIIAEGTEERELFTKLKESGIRKAVLLGKDTAIYFEALGGKYIMVGVERSSAGFAKIYAKRILGEDKKKIDLRSIEEAFEFAKKVENASLDELAKLR